MNDRLKAWIGFNDGNCDKDTQMLIDDIRELESRIEKLRGALVKIDNEYFSSICEGSAIANEALEADDKARRE